MRRAIVALAVCLLSACATRHHDVLIFGTDTSLGVNVGADPANAQVTNISIGYKRREAVWMPLIVNATESAVYCAEYASDGSCSRLIPGIQCLDPPNAPANKCTKWGMPYAWDPKYQGRAEGVASSVGGSKLESDTYSVFASFGGEAGGGTGSAKAAVAQFFATGIAAQRLGASDNASKLISTSPVDPVGEQAKGKLEVLQSTPDSQETASETAKQASIDQDRVVDCLFASGLTSAQKTAKMTAIGTLSGVRPEDLTKIQNAATPSALRAELSSDSLQDSLDEIATTCAAN
jgi:hypothetical protein